MFRYRLTWTLLSGGLGVLALCILVGIALVAGLDATRYNLDVARFPGDPALSFLRPAGPQVFGSTVAFWCCLASSLLVLVWALFRSFTEGWWWR